MKITHAQKFSLNENPLNEFHKRWTNGITADTKLHRAGSILHIRLSSCSRTINVKKESKDNVTIASVRASVCFLHYRLSEPNVFFFFF